MHHHTVLSNILNRFGTLSWKVVSILVVFDMLLPSIANVVEVYAAEDLQLPAKIEDESVVLQAKMIRPRHLA